MRHVVKGLTRLSVGLVLTMSLSAFADDAGTTAPSVPQQNAPEWFRQPPANQGQPGAYVPNPTPPSYPPSGPVFGNQNQYSYYSSDYPGRDVNNWVFATTHAATARALFDRAENGLAAAYDRAKHHFEHSQAYLAATAEQKDAYDAYQAVREKALAELNADPKYKELLKLREEMSDKIAAKRAIKETPKEEILALAQLKLAYASDARSMETAVLTGNQELADAHKRMMDTARKTAQLQADHDEAMRDDPQILVARANLEDARISLITAQAYQDSSAVAGSAAIDYAYYLHRNDFSTNNNNPYGYGYGGVYSPYWNRN